MFLTATSIRLTAEVKITDFSTSFPSLSLALNTPSAYWSLSTPTIQCLTSPLSLRSLVALSWASLIDPLPVQMCIRDRMDIKQLFWD